MDTNWQIVGTDGQFLVIEYTRGGSSIRLQALPPTPGEGETMEEALARMALSHEPTPEQFAGTTPAAPEDLVGKGGTTAVKRKESIA